MTPADSHRHPRFQRVPSAGLWMSRPLLSSTPARKSRLSALPAANPHANVIRGQIPSMDEGVSG